MGAIEISDGITSRRIPTSAFGQTVRIEAGTGDDPVIILPESFQVERRAADD